MSRYNGWDLEQMRTAGLPKSKPDTNPERLENIDANGVQRSKNLQVDSSVKDVPSGFPGSTNRNPVIAEYLDLDVARSGSSSAALPSSPIVCPAEDVKRERKRKRECGSGNALLLGERGSEAPGRTISGASCAAKPPTSYSEDKENVAEDQVGNSKQILSGWPPEEQGDDDLLSLTKLNSCEYHETTSSAYTRSAESATMPATTQQSSFLPITSYDLVKSQQGNRPSIYPGSSPGIRNPHVSQMEDDSSQRPSQARRENEWEIISETSNSFLMSLNASDVATRPPAYTRGDMQRISDLACSTQPEEVDVVGDDSYIIEDDLPEDLLHLICNHHSDSDTGEKSATEIFKYTSTAPLQNLTPLTSDLKALNTDETLNRVITMTSSHVSREDNSFELDDLNGDIWAELTDCTAKQQPAASVIYSETAGHNDVSLTRPIPPTNPMETTEEEAGEALLRNKDGFTTHITMRKPSSEHTGEQVKKLRLSAQTASISPLIRPPFRAQMRDRSPIIGLSASTVLRTCFRVGEALKSGSSAIRSNRDVVIELYAVVIESYREDGKHYFTFADAFHDRPPLLRGCYNLWKGSSLWDFDSRCFLNLRDQSKLCRCLGRMKREEHAWKLQILNIWEAKWEDVHHVAGILIQMETLKRPLSPTTASTSTNPTSRPRLESQLTSGLHASRLEAQRDDQMLTVSVPQDAGSSSTIRSPRRQRSVSDSTPVLIPSPNIRESRPESKDDHDVPTEPSKFPQTPRRPDFSSKGLSLQMPPNDLMSLSAASPRSRGPLSPQLDTHETYGSPATVLPRHSRGLDFSRACTNLHHSTLADQSSPDSSPTVMHRGLMIPPRKLNSTMSLDSPSAPSAPMWPPLGKSDRTVVSSSLGSMSMLETESSSNSSDDDEPMEQDEGNDILTTPQVHKANNVTAATPFQAMTLSSPTTATWSGNFSPAGAAASLMNYQRARLRHRRSRKSSSSASGQSSLASPITASPPPMRDGGGYFNRDYSVRTSASRRESISMVTNELHISSGNESGDETGRQAPPTPGVVRRPVTRRGNLLPKTKGFARIRATLLEESTPVDSEVRREAEIVRQVRESDESRNQSSIGATSPNLTPTIPEGIETESLDEDGMRIDVPTTEAETPFGNLVRDASINSDARDYWANVNGGIRTPPTHRASSSALSEDINIDTFSSILGGQGQSAAPATQSIETTAKDLPTASNQLPNLPTPAEMARKVSKRRREDDFDITSFKRRAVSPGMSVQNSPILAQSPVQRDGGWWPQPKVSREGSSEGKAHGERSNSASSMASSAPIMAPKRIGMQGMTDTHDGMMKMSID
ncbi:MAG: hypothetical protein M1820_001324 [Bogoriella megaspora]|nr:MAG: hypothetical protein M1820_001324 [Bogoriella megaspora]